MRPPWPSPPSLASVLCHLNTLMARITPALALPYRCLVSTPLPHYRPSLGTSMTSNALRGRPPSPPFRTPLSLMFLPSASPPLILLLLFLLFWIVSLIPAALAPQRVAMVEQGLFHHCWSSPPFTWR